MHFPDDESQQPAIGFPTPVRDDGTISLPLIAPIHVEGRTLPEVEQFILNRYSQEKILLEQRQRIIVSLMKRRTYQVLVVREDQGVPLTHLNSESMIVGSNKRGMSYAVDLPAYENDVLHALSETGGLPGNDAKNELIVLRGGFDPEQSRREKVPLLLNPVSGEEIIFDGEMTDIESLPLHAEPDIETLPRPDQDVQQAIPKPERTLESVDDVPLGDGPSSAAGQPHLHAVPEYPPDIRQYIGAHGSHPNVIRIPLRAGDGPAALLRPEDIILKTGDIVFVRSREKEVFYTGGVLPSGQFPLPRDYKIDVLEAIALAGGSVAPSANGMPQSVNNSGQAAVFPATRVIILRRRGHQQVPIEVDLRRAFHDPRERITIEPGDFITLEYRAKENVVEYVAVNLAL